MLFLSSLMLLSSVVSCLAFLFLVPEATVPEKIVFCSVSILFTISFLLILRSGAKKK